jgi:hypothetical protein
MGEIKSSYTIRNNGTKEISGGFKIEECMILR